MFAVFKAGGHQYRVNQDDVIVVNSLAGEVGDTVVFSDVLMTATAMGSPLVAGASVAGEIVEHKRGDKVIAFKKRRSQNSKRRRGHRQHLTVVRIAEILLDGAKPSGKKAAPKKAKDESAEGEAAAAAPKAAPKKAPADAGGAGKAEAKKAAPKAAPKKAPAKPKA